ncbi:SAM-dependent methyltransferase [Jannaschia pagri]|uniref:SAM-dependent methyltransferase n=1 Tax=Jannaschia pagri TaxID=2829797 RepID=A0ABQ4NPD6_9RHOB|nr:MULTISPECIES: RsmB/NOP family class I SAM-dependent RNA methyltransferase [unclassified Jannaschia]GIT92255.1 SAM-dependent methyltransferase [Jannaschia sp. AI_61]GIT96089.1 SAM-dependent methyltransferase [Jannaschia sp. AI_62]
MTPGARVQAAIEVLDGVLAGAAAEQALTRWARRSRYAGSKDRAAVRDHVFDALRRLRSSAWLGGLSDMDMSQMEGSAVLAGTLRGQGADLDALFTGQGHAPAPWDRDPPSGVMPDSVALDCPDWLLPSFRDSLGQRAEAVLLALRDRAPVVLRANTQKATRDQVAERLAQDGVETAPHPLSPTALRVVGPARGLTNLEAFAEGLFELQDAGSQSLVDRVPVVPGQRILDLCSGGGGKALALAARHAGEIMAHDADPRRMRDLPARARRAGAGIQIVETPERFAPFDGVIADVPCSGSGSWRRAPEAKWRLIPERLEALTTLQHDILRRAVDLTNAGGWIAYMTCSLLRSENEAVVETLLSERSDLRLDAQWRCDPLDDADGFHLSILRKA